MCIVHVLIHATTMTTRKMHGIVGASVSEFRHIHGICVQGKIVISK